MLPDQDAMLPVIETMLETGRKSLRRSEAVAVVEPSAGVREGPAPRMEEPSAGVREGPAPRMKEPSAGVREGPAPRMKEPSAGVRQGPAPRSKPSLDGENIVQQAIAHGVLTLDRGGVSFGIPSFHSHMEQLLNEHRQLQKRLRQRRTTLERAARLGKGPWPQPWPVQMSRASRQVSGQPRLLPLLADQQ